MAFFDKREQNVNMKKITSPLSDMEIMLRNVVCDASLTEAGDHLSQGEDLTTAKNVAFWSRKFNSAQQNYPTHDESCWRSSSR